MPPSSVSWSSRQVVRFPSVVAVKPGAVLLNSICLGMTTSTDTRPGSPQPCTANAA